MDRKSRTQNCCVQAKIEKGKKKMTCLYNRWLRLKYSWMRIYTGYRRLMFDTLLVVDPPLLPAEDFADTAVTDP